MANTTIDFGQSSTPQLSLRPFLNKQETALPVAQDIAQAIQVAGNAGKMFSQIEDEAQQARYFNANIEFNNLKAKQQDELLAVGNDLNAYRQVLDAYRPQLEGLATKYELNDKYKATLGGSIEAHNSGFEEKYRGAYNAQQTNIALANVATAAAGLVGNPDQEAVMSSLQGLREYYKQVSGEDDRTVGTKIADIYMNAKLETLDPTTITWEQANQFKKELDTQMKTFDNKLVTDSKFNAKLDYVDRVIAGVKAEEIKNLKMMMEGDRPQSAFNKVLSTYKARGIIDAEEATYYAEVYKDKRETEQLQALARKEALSNDVAKRLNWQTAYTTKTEEEVRALYNKEVKAGRLDPDQAEYEIRQYMYNMNKQIGTKKKAIDKENVGFLEANNTTVMSDGVPVPPEVYEQWKRNLTDDGALGADAQKAVENYRVRWIADTKPEAFNKGTAIDFNNPTAAKTIANEKIQESFLAFIGGKEKDLSKVATLARNYGTNGDLSATITTYLQDPKAFGTMKAVFTELKTAAPTDYKKIFGEDNAARFEMLAMLTKRAKLPEPDKATIELTEKIFKDRINFDDDRWKDTDKRVNNVLNDYSIIADREEFVKKATNLYRIGMNPKDIANEIEKEVKFNRSDNINIDLTQYPVQVSTKHMELLEEIQKFEVKETNGAQVLIAWNPATKTVWRYLNGKSIGEDTKQKTLEDYTTMMQKVMETKKKQEADIKAKNIRDAEYDRQLKEVRGY